MAIELEPEVRTREDRKRIRQQNSPHRRTDRDAHYLNEIIYQHGAKNVIKLIIPISICMLMVVFELNIELSSTVQPEDFKFYSTPFAEDSTEVSVIMWQALVNSLYLVGSTIISTTLLVILYVYKFYKVIVVWFLLSTLLILFVLTFMFFRDVLRFLNIPIDYFSTIIFHWNFGVTGMICVFWKGPLKLQQGYLVFLSARGALMCIEYLPEWTTWTALFLFSVWDVYAVMTSRGPLKKLIDTAAERGESIPSILIYSTFVYGAITSPGGNISEDESIGNSVTPSTGYAGESNQQNTFQLADTQSSLPPSLRKLRRRRRRRKLSEKAGEGFRLGLGDFLMYSMLVGKASSFGNWSTAMACFVAVLIGLCCTLILLVRVKKALPALPISISIGMNEARELAYLGTMISKHLEFSNADFYLDQLFNFKFPEPIIIQSL